MKNNIKFILQRLLGYQRYLYWFSIFKIRTLKRDKKERDFFKFLSEVTGPGAILDIGANIGIMTYHLAKRFPDRKIFSIEPMPDNLTVLEQIVNKYNLSNVELLPFAVGDSEGELEMILPLNGKVKMQGLAHVVHDTIEEWNIGNTIKTRSISLDSQFENIPIAGIKMDIENFEYFALLGGKTLLADQKPVIYLELWDNKNRDNCFKLLKEIGYKTYVVQSGALTEFDEACHHHQNFIFKV